MIRARTVPTACKPWVAGRRSFCAVAFLLLPSPVLSRYQTPSNATQDSGSEMHSAEGRALARAGNLQPAEAEPRKASELAPANEGCLVHLATVLAMPKNFDEST